MKKASTSKLLDLIRDDAVPQQPPQEETFHVEKVNETDIVIPSTSQQVLLLQKNLKGPEQNWTKYPNQFYPLIKQYLKRTGEETVFRYLWWQSWGSKNKANFCRISQAQVVRDTLITTTRTVQSHIDALAKAQFIVKGLLPNGVEDRNKQGSLYRIFTQEEIGSQTSNEEIPFNNIPITGMVMVTPEKITGVKITGVTSDDGQTPNNTGSNSDSQKNYPRKNYGGKNDSSKIHGSKNYRSTPEKITGVKITGDRVDADETTDSADSRKNYSCKNYPPLKEESLKDSLSLDPVKLFYTGIGQQKISKTKRERGNSVLQELQKEGFSTEDIQFAIEWTLKPGNTKEKVHDFSIISHTIGQALAAREAGQQAAKSTRKEVARVRAAEEEERRLKDEIKKKLSGMNPNELAELENQAREEMSGVNAEFITKMSISGKMKEILGRS